MLRDEHAPAPEPTMATGFDVLFSYLVHTSPLPIRGRVLADNPFVRWAMRRGAVLVLRRGVTGGLDLYTWWDAARREKTPPTRTVTIQLLADDQRTIVMTWRFLRAYPVTLSYSPLNAMTGGVLMEQVSLAFERVEMGDPG